MVEPILTIHYRAKISPPHYFSQVLTSSKKYLAETTIELLITNQDQLDYNHLKVSGGRRDGFFLTTVNGQKSSEFNTGTSSRGIKKGNHFR